MYIFFQNTRVCKSSKHIPTFRFPSHTTAVCNSGFMAKFMNIRVLVIQNVPHFSNNNNIFKACFATSYSPYKCFTVCVHACLCGEKATTRHTNIYILYMLIMRNDDKIRSNMRRRACAFTLAPFYIDAPLRRTRQEYATTLVPFCVVTTPR